MNVPYFGTAPIGLTEISAGTCRVIVPPLDDRYVARYSLERQRTKEASNLMFSTRPKLYTYREGINYKNRVLAAKLRTELRSYSLLSEGWDGDGARAPIDQAIDDALLFLERKPYDIPIPNPQVCSDGSVGLYWRTDIGPFHAEVNFEGDGTFACFSVQGTPSEVIDQYGEDGLDVNSAWPEGLRRMLDYDSTHS